MLTVQQISKSYGIHTVLANISFNVNEGEHLALIGPNGCGKTTLLKILTGEEKPDSGTVLFNDPTARAGYLPQYIQYEPEDTIASYLERTGLDEDTLNQRLETISAEMALRPDRMDLQTEYDRLLSGFEMAAWQTGQKPRLLAAFGLAQFSENTRVDHLSGGQKTRLGLTAVLLSHPKLLILDEPTNHLDLEMLIWLEEWLQTYPGAVLVVSHDRSFLDHVPTAILELNPASHQIHEYAGNYSTYLTQKQAERDHQYQAYSDQQVELAQLRGAAAHLRGIAKFKKGGKADTGDKFAKGFFANRGKATIGRAKQIEARIDHILTEEKIDKPGSSWKMKMELTDAPESGRDVLVCDDLTIGYGQKPILEHLSLTLRYNSRCAFIGPNGCGKSTFLKTIAGLLPALYGSYRLGSSVQAGYLSQAQDELDPEKSPFDLLSGITGMNETDTRAYLHKYLFTSDNVFLPTRLLSLGERTRLSLAAFIAQGRNLLLLDEPLNHLDISSRERFEEALAQFNGTVLIVAHDRYFIERYASSIWEISTGRIIQTEMI
jgi:ATP-binding cassette, subfamily F, member 3